MRSTAFGLNVLCGALGNIIGLCMEELELEELPQGIVFCVFGISTGLLAILLKETYDLQYWFFGIEGGIGINSEWSKDKGSQFWTPIINNFSWWVVINIAWLLNRKWKWLISPSGILTIPKDFKEDNVIVIYPTVLYVAKVDSINMLNDKLKTYIAVKGDDEDEVEED